MKTMSFAALLVLGTASFLVACAAAPSDDADAAESEGPLVTGAAPQPPPPAPLPNGQQCASVSISQCVGSTLGGPCVTAAGAPGVCASFQSPPQWIALPPPQSSGWDCNLCVFADPIPVPPAGAFAKTFAE
jgi:hypothetical protein